MKGLKFFISNLITSFLILYKDVTHCSPSMMTRGRQVQLNHANTSSQFYIYMYIVLVYKPDCWHVTSN